MGTDAQLHIGHALIIRQDLRSLYFYKTTLEDRFNIFMSIFTHGPIRWPRFTFFISALISFLPGGILFWIRFSNMIYFTILIISIYLLGKTIFSQQAGFIAAYYISFYPAIFGLSRSYGLDFPLISIVCLAMYVLLSCEGFKNLYYSILFGIVSGLGMLIKGQFVIFVAGPLLLAVLSGLRNKVNKKAFFVNILISTILAVLISLIWWHKLFPLGSEKNFLTGFSFSKSAVPQSLIYYLKQSYISISPVFFTMFLVGLFSYFFNYNRQKLFFLLWLVIPLIFFTKTYVITEERFIYPVFGPVALIAGIGLSQAPLKKIKKVLIWFFLGLGILQFFLLSFYQAPANFIAHAPEKNNHRLIMYKFNRLISECPFEKRNIGIVEGVYFRGDFAIRLDNFLRLIDRRNNVSLSARTNAFCLTRLSSEFLSKINDYEFLIVFSDYCNGPDFSGLLDFSESSERNTAMEALNKFKGYTVLTREILRPELICVYLMKKE